MTPTFPHTWLVWGQLQPSTTAALHRQGPSE
eukprot:CAMPEP_0202859860 /NCGR_PEP_ID=MMETSP1391-20130828/1801_1 /ASSEMBLY_ACC=CAM_ASM_000867 /TAXON_ID=1034604 /ORGANISM="Chlamydomonas leiostraca, Strain SAG 11-49" /LENGTH=30 /DNA_ID= /DNA_START= /DNA_END= /DNA_ORIENTATION=